MQLDDDGLVAVEGGIVVLEPETWVQKPLPLRGYLDIGDTLGSGRWVVVLYSHSCPSCRRALPQYEAAARQWRRSPDAPRLALVEVPPYGPPQAEDQSSQQIGIHRGRLDQRHEWFVRVPVSMDVDDGVVTAVPSTFLTRRE
jgi:thiol-disulfide isomerase/thioredoxin